MSDPNNIMSAPYAEFLERTLRNLSKEPCKSIVVMALSEDGQSLFSVYHMSTHDMYIFEGLLRDEATRRLLDDHAEEQ